MIYMEILDFFMKTNTSCANSKNFISSFLILMTEMSFFCFVLLARISSTISNGIV